MADRPRILDDIAGVAGGALSALVGIREEIEAIIRARLDEARNRSVKLALAAGCSFAAPPAGLFGWVDTGVDTDALAQRVVLGIGIRNHGIQAIVTALQFNEHQQPVILPVSRSEPLSGQPRGYGGSAGAGRAPVDGQGGERLAVAVEIEIAVAVDGDVGRGGRLFIGEPAGDGGAGGQDAVAAGVVQREVSRNAGGSIGQPIGISR